MKVIGYNQKYFKPFATARIVKDFIPDYIWCMDNEEGEEVVIPTNGMTVEQIKYVFAKERFLTFLAHAELNELGVEKYQKDLSLFDFSEFHPFDAIRRPAFYGEPDEKMPTQVSYLSWFIDWTRGFENYSVVVDIFVRPYSYLHSSFENQFKRKRVYLFDALKKQYKSDAVKKVMESINSDLLPQNPVINKIEESSTPPIIPVQNPLISMDLDLSFDLSNAIPMSEPKDDVEEKTFELVETLPVEEPIVMTSVSEDMAEDITEKENVTDNPEIKQVDELGNIVEDEPDEYTKPDDEQPTYSFTFNI